MLVSTENMHVCLNLCGSHFRGVLPTHVPAVWALCIHPRVYFFPLWLLSKNKVLTRDNVEKRKHLDDNSCLFLLRAKQCVTSFSDVQ